jgi:predicted Zn-dependent protease
VKRPPPERIADELRRAPGIDEFSLELIEEDRYEHLYSQSPARYMRRTQRAIADVFVDGQEGRGHASVELKTTEALAPQIAAAREMAERAMGPAWRMPPPAAPARVRTSYQAWAADPTEHLDALAAMLIDATASGATVPTARLSLRVASRRVITSGGFDNSTASTTFHLDATLRARGGETVPLRAVAMQPGDVHLQRDVEAALRQSKALTSARPVSTGRFDVALDIDAYAPLEAEDFGFFTPIVEQARGALVSAGLSLYQRGQAIESGEARGDRLSVDSDGTLDFGMRSHSFGEHGQPVRRFPLVKHGRAGELALGLREAALRGALPNGGAGNLVIEGGSKHAEELLQPGADRSLLHIHRVAAWSSSARGDLETTIDWATLRSREGAAVAIAGGLLADNLFSLLTECYFSRERARRGFCTGPRVIRLQNVTVRA